MRIINPARVAVLVVAGVCFYFGSLAQAQTSNYIRFSYNSATYILADGSIDAEANVVVDNNTGLQWRRCSEGQRWSGSNCTGNHATFRHDAALVNAQNRSGWRLPNVKELSSLADKGILGHPAIISGEFPDTPASYYWSSSPHASYEGTAWVVNFGAGNVTPGNRVTGDYAVRLVRANP